MKAHLFEFHSEKRKLKCLCGWERTLRTTDVREAYKRFGEHRSEASRPER